jgi:hypothetical protein
MGIMGINVRVVGLIVAIVIIVEVQDFFNFNFL